MADEQQLALIKQGADVWNNWREKNLGLAPNFYGARLRGANLSGADLSNADLSNANLSQADLSGADISNANRSGEALSGVDLSWVGLRGARLSKVNLSGADLRWADLREVNLRGACLRGSNLRGVRLNEAELIGSNLSGSNLNHADLDLSKANLYGANLYGARLSATNLTKADLSGSNLTKADLSSANLNGANLSGACLRKADLNGANLREAILVQTDFSKANLDGSLIYGISAWKVNVEGAIQSNLVITSRNESMIMVDNLEVAQFVYLLLNNQKIRDVISTIGKKAVLILGQFTERKHVLDTIRDELRKRGYLPVVFDFERPTQRDFTETVMTLAGMCLFIIADITKPRSVPLELQAIVPDYMIPFVPIIEKGEQPFSMFQDLWQKHRDWVLDPLRYNSVTELVDFLDQAVIAPAKRRRDELEARKAEALIIRDIKDYR